jgi:hypothetical protein
MLDQYNGDNTCIQVAVDWWTPNNEDHYDRREFRNCDPNSHMPFSFTEPASLCGGGTTNCDMSMHRVHFARLVGNANGIYLAHECRIMGDNEPCYNTGSWLFGSDLGGPICIDPYYVCRLEVRQRDGTTAIYNNNHPLRSDCRQQITHRRVPGLDPCP